MDSCLQCCHLLKAASALSDRHLRKSLEGSALSLSQAMLLICLSEKPCVSMSELGRSLCCHKSNVTQLIDELLKSGLVVQKPCATDRRITWISLTAKGTKQVEGIHKGLAQHAEHCLKDLGVEELKTFADLLALYIASNERSAVVEH